jgi:hypothetical protein
VAAFAQRLEIRALVRLAFALEQCREGTVAARTHAPMQGDGQLELGEVLACDEVAQVGR